jgi:hypothetical protein
VIGRALRSPLLHFLVLGAALLGLRHQWTPEDRGRIVLDAGDVDRLRRAWALTYGAPPDVASETRLVRAAVDEEILYREALAQGFDRRDEAVRERLVRLGGFVGEEPEADRAALEETARALGLEHSDLVVRRQLVEMMRLASGRVGAEELPTEKELEAYFARHAAEFAQPGHVRLRHVYLSADARGARLEADARTLLGTLRATDVSPDAASDRGDPFIRGAVLAGSPAELERNFGPGFATAVAGAPIGRWFGPVRSVYGLHLVWVDARAAETAPAFSVVRGRVLHRWLYERRAQRAGDTITALRAKYDVVTAGR